MTGRLGPGLEPKDIILAIIRKIGTGGATGHVIEYYGPAIEALSMEGRMTVCNMSIEAGARAGLIAPDDVTIEFITRDDRPFAPRGADLDAAIADWRKLRTDDPTDFDRHVTIDAGVIVPQVTWGTNPAMTVDVTGVVPRPDEVPFATPEAARAALQYMGLEPGTPISAIPVDVVFIGSCTNGRIEDLRAAARVFQGRKTAPGVQALVVPGSEAVRHQAEAEGPRSHLQRGRRRVASGGMQHVPGHEPRQAQARSAVGQHEQSQFRGSSRAREAAPTWSAQPWPPPPPSPAISPMSAIAWLAGWLTWLEAVRWPLLENLSRSPSHRRYRHR